MTGFQQRCIGEAAGVAELTGGFLPTREVGIKQAAHLRGSPRDVVNTVGDGSDVGASKHRGGHLCVEVGHGVDGR